MPPSAFTLADFTDEDIAAFKEHFERARRGPHVLRPLPPGPALTPEATRDLLRACAVVMRPGETLVIRVPDYWTPLQVGEYNTWLAGMTQDWPVRVIAGWGEDFALALPAEGQ